MVGYITTAHGSAQRLSEKWRHFVVHCLYSLFCTSPRCVGVAQYERASVTRQRDARTARRGGARRTHARSAARSRRAHDAPTTEPPGVHPLPVTVARSRACRRPRRRERASERAPPLRTPPPVRSSRCPSRSHARASTAPLEAASERASYAPSNAPLGVGMRCFLASEGAPEATAFLLFW